VGNFYYLLAEGMTRCYMLIVLIMSLRST